MNSDDLLSRLRSHNIRLRAENDQIRYIAPKGGMTDDLLAEIRMNKDELLNLVKNTERFRRAVSLVPVKRTDTLRLSFAQERLWTLYHLFPEIPVYNVPLIMRLAGVMDIPALQKSLQALIDRHETLRTCFPTIDDQPVQVILDDCPVPLLEHNLKDLPEAERETAADKVIEEEIQRPFDLTHGPVIRAALLRMADQDHILLITLHHIVTDGWSQSIIRRDLSALYNARVLQQTPTLPALPIQYVDFAHWQRQWLTGEVLEGQLRYWRAQLAEVSTLHLPMDRPRPPVQTHSGARYTFQLSKSLTQDLQALSRQSEVTLATMLLAAFQALLGRYTGQTDIAVGTPIANRTRPELENLVGFFVNTLVMRTDLFGDPTFRALLGRVHSVALGAYEHQHLPFEQLVAELQPERDFGRNPLFQAVFAFQNVPREETTFHGLNIRPMSKNITTTHMDLECFAWEGNEELHLALVYNTDLFDQETIERFGTHFQRVLTEVVRDPDQRISDVQILTDAERQQLLFDWNDNSNKYPRDHCVHQLFEQQVEQSPDAVAVVYGYEQLTYRELNARANQLAHYLEKLGVGPEVLVGICLERSLEMIIAVLGILKAGGAYVPLDPEYPQGRLGFMLADTGSPVLMTHSRLVEELPRHEARVICIDSDWDAISRHSEETPVSATSVENLAYVIYTSGSTGKPKGVAISHGGLLNLVFWHCNVFEVTASDRATHLAGTAFDASVWEVWPYLTAGARLQVVSAEKLVSPEQLRDWLVSEEITITFLPTPVAEQVLKLDWPQQMSLRTLLTGGDKLHRCPPESIQFKVVNNYGPTENTVVSTSGVVLPDSDAGLQPSIGYPISNTDVYVLDERLRPVPVGVPGELYIGGESLARGYLNRPNLTAENFIPNPYSVTPGARLYKSGDLVRYLQDGSIEFLGRIDHQVKIRGFRIELGEIEGVLGRHPALEEAVVIARENGPGDKRLVAYVVASHKPTPTFSELRSFLKEKLPDYMIPTAFVYLDSLPITPNGKVDRRALPTPDVVRPELDTAYQAPWGGVEQTLAQIWKQVLRVDQVGRQDNFFELGGDSILSIQIVARANQAGLRVAPKHIFQYQTIAELAEVVEALKPVAADQGVVTGPLPLSPIQHWFFGRQLEEPNHWNMAWVLEANQPVDPKKMELVVEALLRHHDALRLRFVPHNTGWKQELGAPNQPVPLTFIDLSHLPYKEAAAAFSQEADRLHTTLNLFEGALIQVALFKFSEHQADRVLLVIHHLAVDGISWRILLDDLQTAFDQLCVGGSIQLPPKTTSYKEWTEGLVEYAQSKKLHEEVSYWRAVANIPCRNFPRDFVDGINTAASTRTVSVGLGQEDTRALLQEIPGVYHTQINDVLLAALVDVLAQWSRQETICLNLEGHGREELLEDTDLSRTVGWFTSIFPVVLKRGTPGHAGELLKSVKEQLRQIPHRGVGYGLLRYLRESGKVRDNLRDGLDPELSFNYLGQFDQVIAEDGRWRWSGASGGANRNPQDRQTHLISVNARIMNSVLQVHWSYSEAVHRRETIENLAQNYLAALVTIIRHCQSPEAGGYTPSDFPLARVGQSDLDKVLLKTKSGDGKAVISDLYPLTPLQQGLWFHALANPESGVYFEQSVFRIEGYTNRDVLRQAWEKVVEQHTIFRTGIIWEGLEHPRQLVRSTVELPWAEVDWQESPDNEHQSRLLQFLDEDRLRGFDLTQAPLMRLTLIQVAETSAILVWSFHHLILDRWSVDLVQQEVWSAYQSLVQGQPLQVKALRPYREYIGWLQDQDLNRAKQYWRQLLNGFTAPTVLGVDQAPPTRVGHQESSYDSEKVTLSEAASSALSRWARQQQLTVNTVVQGTLAVLLSRYSGSEDVVFGTTVSGRSAGLPGIESMVGLFINTLPVRVHVPPVHSAVPWLTELQEQQVTMREYEYTPLFEIQKWSEVPPGEPLFNTLLVFENIPLESGEKLMTGTAGLNVQRVAGTRGGESNYPLTVVVVPGRMLQVRLTYDIEHYTAEAITRMVGHFQQVLTGMIGDNEQTLLGAIPLLTEAEHQLMLVEWNATGTTYPDDRCVHQLFEQQVEQSPDAEAVVYEDEQLTYQEINFRANQLAHYLRAQGIGPDTPVAILVERSCEMVMGWLGILKAGGAYVPLDPSYPEQRLALMLKDSKAPVLLTMESMKDRVPDYQGRILSLDSDTPEFEGQPVTNPCVSVSATNLAYVIYTSGSTGEPKGVAIPHRAVNRLVCNTDYLQIEASDRVAQASNASFDAATFEIWGALLHGARLIGVAREMTLNPKVFADFLDRQRITAMFITTALFNQMARETPWAFCGLRALLFGGEAVDPRWVRQVLSNGPPQRLLHVYGPTETTTFATWYELEEVPEGALTVPIGIPIANTQAYILDRDLQLVPIGVAGQLYTGGDGLARGYLNRPELTAEKFISDPFSEDPAARLYKTGDLARYLPDGSIEFLGRIDHQVKIRGFRIELGEIELVLGQHPAVEEAVVIAREDVPGDKRLVAYVVANREPTPTFSELRSFLKETLPDYMIPSAFGYLDSLPITPNGKVDRRALPAPDVVRPDLKEAFVAPRSQSEEQVAGIWSNVLGLERIGVYDSLFEIGGHSLLVVQIVSRIREVFEVELPVRSLFETPTIAGLTELIETILVTKQRPRSYRETTTSDREEIEI